MKWIKKLKGKLTGLTDAIARFPLTTVFLLAAAIINAYGITSEKDIYKILLTFLIGAFLSAVAQVVQERYFSKISARFVLMGAVVLLTAGYYLIIRNASTISMEIETRTAVAMFALLIAFIWVPVIKSIISFNQSFMISFKSLFNSLFFSGVIFAGIAIILGATDLLIAEINSKAYPHTANIVFILFAPMYFLSLIPVYPGAVDLKKDQPFHEEETIKRAATVPKFLEILISYILIPLVAVFTLILVIYIVQNIGGEFWEDNLLEPMLVSYSITVIVLYILASEIENKFTAFFRKVFPKLLVPIVLFQITSSILTLAETGVTHTRYYVILFGIFAAASGALLSFLPVRKNGIIAVLLIILATVSIVPPVDAFTVSRTSQINTLEDVLSKHNMLEDDKITPNEAIPDEDKETITNVMEYLSRMEYTKYLEWLPENFEFYKDFHSTFGFTEYQDQGDSIIESRYLFVEHPTPIRITGYDVFVQTEIYHKEDQNEEIFSIEKDGIKYTLKKEYQDDQIIFKLINESNSELISFETQEIYDKFYDYPAVGKGVISAEEATFTKENERAQMYIVAQNINIEKSNNQEYNHAELYVFVKIK